MGKRNSQIRLTPEQQLLAEQNVRLAYDIAWKFSRSTGIEFETLKSAALEGLCQACAKYDPTMLNTETGLPLRISSLAVPYIRGSLLHWVRDRTYSLRLTHRMREQWVKGRKLLMRGECDIKIAQALEISLKEWQEVKTACSGPPLELKDQATPTEALEADEVDHLTPFREEASEAIGKMTEDSRQRLQKYINGRSVEPTAGVLAEISKYLPLGTVRQAKRC